MLSQLTMLPIVVMHKITQKDRSFPNHKPPNTCRLQMTADFCILGPWQLGQAHAANSLPQCSLYTAM